MSLDPRDAALELLAPVVLILGCGIRRESMLMPTDVTSDEASSDPLATEASPA
jgi:hypothetical protein